MWCLQLRPVVSNRFNRSAGDGHKEGAVEAVLMHCAHAGRALFTGEKETTMLVNITQLLGPLDWEETVVEDPRCTTGQFKYVAARDLKQL